MWKEGYLTIPTMPCDGCQHATAAADLTFIRADGNTARYCGPCKDIFMAWKDVCQAEENRLNRQLDLFIETSRQQVKLAFVPQDLPRRTQLSDSQLVLG
jgi:hypothetical protein